MSVLTIVIPLRGDACHERAEAVKAAVVASVEAATDEFGERLATEYLQVSITETVGEALDRFY